MTSFSNIAKLVAVLVYSSMNIPLRYFSYYFDRPQLECSFIKLNYLNLVQQTLSTIRIGGFSYEIFCCKLHKHFPTRRRRSTSELTNVGNPFFGAKPKAWRHKTFIFSLFLICTICFCDYKSLFLNNECRL